MNQKIRKIRFPFLLLTVFSSAFSQPQAPSGDIPPNYGFYKLNPEYSGPPKMLGWSDKRVRENLGRGLVAVPAGRDSVHVCWRLLETDPKDVAFNLYRSAFGKKIKLNAEPLQKTTDFLDTGALSGTDVFWQVRPVTNGREQEASPRVRLPSPAVLNLAASFKIRDDLQARSVGKIGIGDLDGDGEYEIVVKRPGSFVDPGRIRKSPDTFKIEAYEQDGTFLWRNDLGWSIELGIWYSPMVVWDLNGDGRAEVAVKTGEGDPRSETGQVLSGPEYVSVWDGKTGKEIARADWIPRGKPSDWGDYTGNRMSRNMMAVAYLDGKTPSLIVCRGQYGLMKMDAWLLHENRLEKVWTWSNLTSGWRYQGQGSHTMHSADVDGDGCDEILNGSIVIDQDGRILYSNGYGHADRFFVTDADPGRPGLESVYCFEDPHPKNGLGIWDAATGELIAGIPEESADNQIGRCLVGDIDPAYPGMEWWGDKFFYTAKGQKIDGPIPPQDGLVWWDADPLREIQSRGTVSKWKGPVLTRDIQGFPLAWVDILGDWREEIVACSNGEIRIYATTIPARDRRICLMQDPVYRFDVAFKAMGYDQPPMTSYFLGNK
jgi:rhamnogalacturonan endolyase